jgi:signal transduction histidine kinase
MIPFDTEKIRRIVVNLVHNAIQATKARSQIMQEEAEPYQPMINVKTSLVTNGVCVEVEDNGGGMDDKTLNHAFEPLFTTRARGTGLGLAIVEKVIEEHNGSISISSTIGQGTKVSFVIPKSGDHKQWVKTNENMREAKV